VSLYRTADSKRPRESSDMQTGDRANVPSLIRAWRIHH